MSLNDITPKQRKVVELLAEGYEMAQIASQMGVTYRTINFHIQRLYERLGVNNHVLLIRSFYDFVAF